MLPAQTLLPCGFPQLELTQGPAGATCSPSQRHGVPLRSHPRPQRARAPDPANTATTVLRRGACYCFCKTLLQSAGAARVEVQSACGGPHGRTGASHRAPGGSRAGLPLLTVISPRWKSLRRCTWPVEPENLAKPRSGPSGLTSTRVCVRCVRIYTSGVCSRVCVRAGGRDE